MKKAACLFGVVILLFSIIFIVAESDPLSNFGEEVGGDIDGGSIDDPLSNFGGKPTTTDPLSNFGGDALKGGSYEESSSSWWNPFSWFGDDEENEVVQYESGNIGCEGTPTPCEDRGLDDCRIMADGEASYGGCHWDNGWWSSNCEGTPTSCETFPVESTPGEFICEMQPGCFVKETVDELANRLITEMHEDIDGGIVDEEEEKTLEDLAAEDKARREAAEKLGYLS